MAGVVVRDIPEVDAGVVERLKRAGCATVHEAQQRTGLMQADLCPVWRPALCAGRAITVLAHPGDNWMLHVAAEQIRPGDVVVVGLSSPNPAGMFGELLATSYMARGAAGLVIDSGCRDVAAISEMKFPVWSRAICAQGTVKETVGSVNVPVVCAGAMVKAGDVIIADDDGIAVVPHADAIKVADAAQARLVKEDATRKRLAQGELGLDIYGMRDRLKEAGLKYV